MALRVDPRSISTHLIRTELERANRRARDAMARLDSQNRVLRKTQQELEKKNKELNSLMDAIKSGKIDTLHNASTASGVVKIQDAGLVEENERLVAELKRSNEDFSLFAFAAAHDLKAPLRHITGFVNVVLDLEGDNLSAEGFSKLDFVQVSAQKLTQLINKLLEYAKVGAKPGNFTQVNLEQLMQRVVADYAEDIQHAQAQVVLEELPSIEGDEVLLYQLFQNILSNALRYRCQDTTPQVDIRCSPVVDDCSMDKATPFAYCIRIEDNGIGFDESHIDKVFRPFTRLVPSSEYEGSGIGMAIVQKIVTIHCGSITAKSQLGCGSTFIITLPSKLQRD